MPKKKRGKKAKALAGEHMAPGGMMMSDKEMQAMMKKKKMMKGKTSHYKMS